MTLELEKPHFQLEGLKDDNTRFHFDQLRLWIDRLQESVLGASSTLVDEGILDVDIGPFTVRLVEKRISFFVLGGVNHRFIDAVPGTIFHKSGTYVPTNPTTGAPKDIMLDINHTQFVRPLNALPQNPNGSFSKYGVANADSNSNANIKLFIVYVRT